MGKSGTIMLHQPPHRICAIARVTVPPAVHVLAIAPAPSCAFWIAYAQVHPRAEPIVVGIERPVPAAEVPEAVASLAPGVDWSEADWTWDPHRPTDRNIWAEELALFRPEAPQWQ